MKKKKRIQNKGLNWKKELLDRRESDYLLGGSQKECIAEIPEHERENCLPIGEIQRGKEDFMDCASRAPINILETKFNWLLKKDKLPHKKWLQEQGYISESGITFSDRFIAILSGTTKTGNSLIAPLQAIHDNGLIPKKLLPAASYMTWYDYHNPEMITSYMKYLGKEFRKRFMIYYERIDEPNFKNFMLDVGGYAWPIPENEIYPRVPYQPNHAFVRIKPNHRIFDNYEESAGDFIKDLAPNYDFLDTGYRIIIDSQLKPKMTWWELIKKFFMV